MTKKKQQWYRTYGGRVLHCIHKGNVALCGKVLQPTPQEPEDKKRPRCKTCEEVAHD